MNGAGMTFRKEKLFERMDEKNEWMQGIIEFQFLDTLLLLSSWGTMQINAN